MTSAGQTFGYKSCTLLTSAPTRRNLEPGGFCEFTDVDLKWKSPDNTLAGTTGEFVNSTFIAACNKGDREPCPGPKLENWVKEAGFEDVHHKTMIIPFGTWPADKKLVCQSPSLRKAALF